MADNSGFLGGLSSGLEGLAASFGFGGGDPPSPQDPAQTPPPDAGDGGIGLFDSMAGLFSTVASIGSSATPSADPNSPAPSPSGGSGSMLGNLWDSLSGAVGGVFGNSARAGLSDVESSIFGTVDEILDQAQASGQQAQATATQTMQSAYDKVAAMTGGIVDPAMSEKIVGTVLRALTARAQNDPQAADVLTNVGQSSPGSLLSSMTSAISKFASQAKEAGVAAKSYLEAKAAEGGYVDGSGGGGGGSSGGSSGGGGGGGESFDPNAYNFGQDGAGTDLAVAGTQKSLTDMLWGPSPAEITKFGIANVLEVETNTPWLKRSIVLFGTVPIPIWAVILAAVAAWKYKAQLKKLLKKVFKK